MRVIVFCLVAIWGCETVYDEDANGLGAAGSSSAAAGCPFEGSQVRREYTGHGNNDGVRCPEYATAYETWSWAESNNFSVRITIFQDFGDGDGYFAEPQCEGVSRSDSSCAAHFEVACTGGGTASEDVSVMGNVIKGQFQQTHGGVTCGYTVTYTPL